MKSSCCNAEIKETHGCDSDFGHQGKCDCDLNGVTWWSECTKCNQPCDPKGIECDMHPTQECHHTWKEEHESIPHIICSKEGCTIAKPNPNWTKRMSLPKQDTQETWEERFDEELGFENYETNGSAVFLHTGKNAIHFLKEYPKAVKAFIKKEIEKATKESINIERDRAYKKGSDMQWRFEKLIKIKEKEAYEKARGEEREILRNILNKYYFKSMDGEAGQCGTCGSKTVMVRGRFPKQPKRLTCPCCTLEHLEWLKFQLDDSSASTH